MSNDDQIQLRKAPTTPGPLIAIGAVAALAGSFALAVGGDAGVLIGLALVWVGGITAGVGVIAMGVLIGVRHANYDEYLARLIEDGEPE